jgi:hypothetical protein
VHKKRKEPNRSSINRKNRIVEELKKRKIIDDDLDLISHDDLLEVNEKVGDWVFEIEDSCNIIKILYTYIKIKQFQSKKHYSDS